MDRNKRVSIPLRGIVKDKAQLQATDGDCEELINLRYEDNAWRGVGMKRLHDYSIVTANVYSNVIQPSMLQDNMFIGYCSEENGVYLITASGRWTSTETLIYALDETDVFKSFAWMNNTLVVFTEQKVVALQYMNEIGFIILPDINNKTIPAPRIAVGEENEGEETYTEITSEWYGDTGAALTQDIFNLIIADFLPKYYEKQNNGFMIGYMNFMFAFKLFDGNYILHQGPFPLNLVVSAPQIYSQGVVPNVQYRLSALVSRPSVYYFFPQNIKDAIQTWYDAGLIQSLSVFMTSPQVPYNFFESDVTKWISHVPPVDFSGVDNLPESPSYFHVGVIEIDDIVNSPTDEPGKFTIILDNGKLQSIETLEVLPVDNFSHHDLLPETTYAFNSRLHLGNITTIPGKIPWPFSDWFDSASAPEEIGCFYPRCDAIMSLGYYSGSIALFNKGILENSDYSLQIAVTIDVDGKKFVSIRDIDVDSLRLWADGLCFRSLVSYPDLRAKKIDIIMSYNGDSGSPRLIGSYNLVKHPFHNFAYYKSTDSLWYKPSFIALPSNNTEFLALPSWNNSFEETFSEQNRVQTSEVNNLFYYPAKQSYRVGNTDYAVRAMIVAQEPMTEMQFGQFPLYVFTSGGVYALEYGNGGDVLYSRITQFLTDVIREGAQPVALSGGAIVYQERSAIKILLGRESKDISRQVIAVSENPLYNDIKLISLTTDNTITHIRGKIDSNAMALTVVDFLTNSNIGYDSKRQEVLFSSPIPSINFYTLVYQLRSGAWYKRTEVIDDYMRSKGGDLAMIRSIIEESGLNRIDLYSLYDEVYLNEGDISEMEYPWIYLQTRPMQLDTKLHKRIFDAVCRFMGTNISSEITSSTVRRALYGHLYNWNALIRKEGGLPALDLTFDDINNAPVSDPYSVDDWNTFFDLPEFGSPFTSVEVNGNKVSLITNGKITIKDCLFPGGQDETFSNPYLVSVIDRIECITAIAPGAFHSCTNLVDVIMPGLITTQYSEVITDMGTFEQCNKLVNLSMPKLTTAGAKTFSYCTGIISFNLQMLDYAGDYCFRNCNKATEFILPNLSYAGDACFYFCSSALGYNLPSLKSTGGGRQFYFNYNALNFTLQLLGNIGDNCFNGCDKLESVDIRSCFQLGSSVLSNGVFNSITGNNIVLTVKSSLMTCNGGSPDGDIQTLQANNTVTIITI